MSFRICTLASGSKGNSSVIFSDTTVLLLDAGLSYRELSARLAKISLSPQNINAVLVTHTHSDHIKGLAMFAKYNPCINIFSNPSAARELTRVGINNVIDIDSFDFFVGDITISPFSVSHDAHCYGYSLLNGGRKITYLTDLGTIPDTVIQNISDSDIVVIESNHDVQMLKANRNYSDSLKRRILGTRGHLSNEACANAVSKIVAAGTVRQILLAHLSENNNTPTHALEKTTLALSSNNIQVGRDVFVDVLGQHLISKVYSIE